jgi:hypothetical protein
LNNTKIRKKKVIHIHSDSKFIDATKVYQGAYFDNIIIFIISPKDKNYSFKFDNDILYIKKSRKGLKKIVNICNTSDLVVLYALDSFKCRIVMNLSKNVKIAWRFFGKELYKQNIVYLSPLTREFIKNNLFKKTMNKLTMNKLKKYLNPFKIINKSINYIKGRSNEFEDSIKRINYFLGLCHEEYEVLKNEFTFLPKFIQIPLKLYGSDANFNNIKSNTIIIGHNKTIQNNHFDILGIIAKSKNINKYNYILPFNYGHENSRYTEKIKDVAKNINNMNLLEKFLPYNEYIKLYQNASACVLNHYRQMAGGNILLALQYGVKLYMNECNVLYKWLTAEGLKIYTIKDFVCDLENENLRLESSLFAHNLIQLKHLYYKNSPADFQKSLYDEIPESCYK